MTAGPGSLQSPGFAGTGSRQGPDGIGHATLAQLVEQFIRNEQVVSSSLTGGSRTCDAEGIWEARSLPLFGRAESARDIDYEVGTPSFARDETSLTVLTVPDGRLVVLRAAKHSSCDLLVLDPDGASTILEDARSVARVFATSIGVPLPAGTEIALEPDPPPLGPVREYDYGIEGYFVDATLAPVRAAGKASPAPRARGGRRGTQ